MIHTRLLAIAEHLRRWPLVTAAVLGLLTPLGFAPFELHFVPVLTVAVLFILWWEQAPRRAALTGFVFGFSCFAVGTHWLYTSIHVFGKAPILVTLLLMLFLWAVMGAYIGLLAYAGARLRCRGTWGRALVLAGGWVLIEWLRGWLFSGFPWFSLGYAQVDGPLAGLAPVGGVYLVSLAMVAAAAALAAAVLAPDRPVRVLLVSVAVVWVIGIALRGVAWTETYTDGQGGAVRVAMVQGNVPQDQKWLPENLVPTMERYWELTEEHWDADIVIWPEAAIPALLHQYADNFLAEVETRADATDTALVMGALRRDLVSGQYHNSLLVAGVGDGLYDKRHLVPFGEYFPVPEFVREWMRLMNLPYVDIGPGASGQSPLIAQGIPLAPSICYEDAFGAEQTRLSRSAAMLVNVSNDAWFGSTIAPHQHLQIARMRAAEARRPMLRTTNSGITAVIGPDGRVQERIAQDRMGVLRAEVQPRTGTTPYLRVSDWLAVLLALALVLSGVVLPQRPSEASS